MVNSPKKPADRFCTKCQTTKPLRHFPNNKSSLCGICAAEVEAEKTKQQVAERKAAVTKRAREKRALQAKKSKEVRTKLENEQKKVRKEIEKQKKKLTQTLNHSKARHEQLAKNQKAKLAKENRLARAELQRAQAEQQKLHAAERELARRSLCRRKLLPFIKKFNRKYDAGWVHHDICARLERFTKAVERQEGPRLMLFMPPRHGKSEIASKNYPAWVLGNHPEWEIIASSYAVSLPIGFSRKVQATIQDPYYQKLFPNTRLHPKNQSAEAWLTDEYEGGYVAAGVGGGITGKGAHVFIIDDPVKDAEEADSDTQRGKVWDWWGSTAKTRLAPGGGVLVIQTRWHDDDLSGRMLSLMKEQKEEFAELIADAKQREAWDEMAQYEEELTEIDRWEVVQYPALAENNEFISGKDHSIIDEDDGHPETMQVRAKGDALHPHRYPAGRLRNMKRSMQPRHWSALYQQNPVPDEGIYFTKDMLRFTSSIPPISDMYLFSAWDLAIGEKQKNDFTVGTVGGLDWQGNIHILEMLRFRGNTHTIAEAIISTYKKYPSLMEIGIEKGQLEMALWPQLQKLMKEQRLYPTFNHELRPITDKWVRARPLQGRMQQGLVLFPHNQPWVDNATQELLRFPGGLHDDIVDSLTWLIRMIGNRKEPPKPGLRNNGPTFKNKLNKILAEQRGTGGHMAS